MKNMLVAPSVLSSDFSDIRNDLNSIKLSGADWVHLDVMDGNFVPNITFGQKFINDIRKHSDMVFDTHLMINNPEKYIKEFADAGSNYITVHCEACKNIPDILNKIRSFGCKAGLAISPETDIKTLIPYLDYVDLILVMTVRPGFGGQSFIESCLDKVKFLYDNRNGRDFLISIDGGVNLQTLPLIRGKGVDVLVTGSSFFKAENKKEYVNLLRCND